MWNHSYTTTPHSHENIWENIKTAPGKCDHIATNRSLSLLPLLLLTALAIDDREISALTVHVEKNKTLSCWFLFFFTFVLHFHSVLQNIEFSILNFSNDMMIKYLNTI